MPGSSGIADAQTCGGFEESLHDAIVIFFEHDQIANTRNISDLE
jgi:hypothetical protein